ncbi:hypothetical protein D4764_0018170 [Takifugu flavidus]|uniref:Uncharacterized protein n=1 Tax=Takifugu flavidus TaxID=433684 RepID=A0A5C6MH40_9TELE|nr:hypothetical protein D4764_0018170 [Takifugu flavidus]
MAPRPLLEAWKHSLNCLFKCLYYTLLFYIMPSESLGFSIYCLCDMEHWNISAAASKNPSE